MTIKTFFDIIPILKNAKRKIVSYNLKPVQYKTKGNTLCWVYFFYDEAGKTLSTHFSDQKNWYEIFVWLMNNDIKVNIKEEDFEGVCFSERTYRTGETLDIHAIAQRANRLRDLREKAEWVKESEKETSPKATQSGVVGEFRTQILTLNEQINEDIIQRLIEKEQKPLAGWTPDPDFLHDLPPASYVVRKLR